MRKTIYGGIAALMLLAISCTKEPMSAPSAATAQTGDKVTAQNTGHYIGERFGGGVIFYIDSTGQHGLIADTVDLGSFAWCNETYERTGATGTDIGTGRANTRRIVSTQGKGKYAAYACILSKRSGYSDWFLPSIGELNELYKQRYLVGGFADGSYWSSSEYNNRKYAIAWWQGFLDGFYNGGLKLKSFDVRAIRTF